MKALHLDENLVFGKGGRRVCYIHPSDPSKCIKVLGVKGNPAKRKNLAPWFKKLRFLSSFDDNLREFKSFQILEKHGDVVWRFFPRCHGLVETNEGLGIVTDLIRNEDGSIPKTVRQYVATYGKTPRLVEALDTFFEFLKKEYVVTRDILDHNIIVKESEAELRIYMIDGFGSSEFIPISLWFKYPALIKIKRKIKRFKKRYGFNLG